MRLASKKLAKVVRVHKQTPKHKKGALHIEDHQRKAEKRAAVENTMETDNTDAVKSDSKGEKVKDRSRTDYKRRILNMTSRNGPRATST